jgi:hypothetical protein
LLNHAIELNQLVQILARLSFTSKIWSFDFNLRNGHLRQIRETRALLARICGGESHFSRKWPLASVGESGESEQHGSASVGESGKSAQHGSAHVGESGESAQHGSANVGESGESEQHGSAQARMIR